MLGAATSPAVAAAQTGHRPAPASTAPSTPADAARPLYQKGRSFEAAGKPDLAYDQYAAAYKLYPHYQIAGTLGTVALKLGKHREAAERISQFLREAQGLSTDERTEKEQQLAAARSRIGTLTFETARGAEVHLDGTLIGRAPISLEVFVEPGSHDIEAKKAGLTAKATIHIAPGKREVVKLRFGPTASLPTDTAPMQAVVSTAISTAASGPMAIPGASPKASNASHPARSVMIGVGGTLTAGGMIAGVITTILSFQKSDELNAEGPWDHKQAIEHERAFLARVATSSFAAAGVALGGTIMVVLLLPQQDGAAAQIGLRPTANGAVLNARW